MFSSPHPLPKSLSDFVPSEILEGLEVDQKLPQELRAC